MKSFLKMLLATILGGIVLLFLLVVLFASIASISAPELQVKPNTVLRIDLSRQIVDRAVNNPFASFDPLSGQPEPVLGLDEILASLKAAKSDDNIKGIYLDGGAPITGNATLREIRKGLMDFKESGKFVYGYTEVLTQKGFYVSSVADTLLVNPEGFMEWRGLSSSVMYYKKALNKLGVEPVVLRATGNKFKSAVEPFINQQMTDANRKQLTELLNSQWNTYLNEIGEARGVDTEKLNRLADSFAVADPRKAARQGLITATGYMDEINAMLMRKTGAEKAQDIPFVKVKKYADKADLDGSEDYSSQKIAVIIAEGEIRSGEGQPSVIGSDRLSGAIRKARTNDKVKGIVLRVNSPGGSAMASEVIWREIKMARKEKPVIASMGDVAASGGYYISCYADTILAQPNTVTGSIGAFGLFFTAQELLNDKLGVNIESVTTNKYSDLGTPDRPITKSEKAILINQVDNIYNTFKKRVATGRDLRGAYVDSIAQGRVYSGKQAKQLGLVDVMGGLDSAIAIAAEKAGLKEGYRVVKYPEYKNPLTRFVENFYGNMQSSMVKDELGEYARAFEVYKKAQNMRGLQMRMSYDLVIE